MPDALECWFFMSYAWADNPDKDPGLSAVSAFYQCLEDALAPKVTATLEQVGFLDRKRIDAGQSWEDLLTRALRGCRAFVPLLTERYFSRESCGKEWAAFEARASRQKRGSELIVPVIWDKLHRIKSSIPTGLEVTLAETHFSTDDLEYVKEYERLGMSVLMQRMEDDRKAATTVRVVVDVITDLIVDRFKAIQLPSAGAALVADWRELKAKFGGSAVSVVTGAPLPTIHFAVAAATINEMEPVRPDALKFYPGADRDWIPYDGPGLSISQVVLETSRSFGHRASWLGVTDHLVEDIRKFERDGCQPVILLVDPWSLEVEALKNPLVGYDQNRFKNSVVIVAWNEEGLANMGDVHARLEQAVRGVFSRSLPLNGESAWFNANVKDVDGLRNALRQAVKDIRALAATEQEPKRPVQSGEAPPVVRNQ